MAETYNCYQGKEISKITEDGTLVAGDWANSKIKNKNKLSFGYNKEGTVEDISFDEDKFLLNRHLCISGDYGKSTMMLNLVNQLDYSTVIHLSKEYDNNQDNVVSSFNDLDISNIDVDNGKIAETLVDSLLSEVDEHGSHMKIVGKRNIERMLDSGHNIKDIFKAFGMNDEDRIIEEFNIDEWEDSSPLSVIFRDQSFVDYYKEGGIFEDIERQDINKIRLSNQIDSSLVTTTLSLLSLILKEEESNKNVLAIDDIDIDKDNLFDKRLSNCRNYGVGIIYTTSSISESQYSNIIMSNTGSFIFFKTSNPNNANLESNVLDKNDRNDLINLDEFEIIYRLSLRGNGYTEGSAYSYPIHQN
jgi:DNA helicase HerA-like ATPase